MEVATLLLLLTYLQKHVFPVKQTTNVKPRMYKGKILIKYISCVCKCKINDKTYSSNQKGNNNNKCQYKCKIYPTYKSDYSWNINI